MWPMTMTAMMMMTTVTFTRSIAQSYRYTHTYIYLTHATHVNQQLMMMNNLDLLFILSNVLDNFWVGFSAGWHVRISHTLTLISYLEYQRNVSLHSQNCNVRYGICMWNEWSKYDKMKYIADDNDRFRYTSTFVIGLIEPRSMAFDEFRSFVCDFCVLPSWNHLQWRLLSCFPIILL